MRWIEWGVCISQENIVMEPTIPEFGTSWYLLDVTHKEEKHPWVELNSQTTWAPKNTKWQSQLQ